MTTVQLLHRAACSALRLEEAASLLSTPLLRSQGVPSRGLWRSHEARRSHSTKLRLDIGVAATSKDAVINGRSKRRRPATYSDEGVEDLDAGEDALFTLQHDQRTVLGVFDGVGGWADQGVDPGVFSSALMRHARRHARRLAGPKRVIQEAYEDVLQDSEVEMGSSTACVAIIDGGQLSAANLGDSSLAVIRDGKALLDPDSLISLHYFNCPHQLAKSTDPRSQSDQPSQAKTISLPLAPSDVVVLATDGIWDNVFTSEVEQLVKLCLAEEAKPEMAQRLADAIVSFAIMSSRSNRRTPFSIGASKAERREVTGGKIDDCSVALCIVR